MREKFVNMKISSRLLSTYAIIIVLSIISSTTALFLLKGVGDNLTSFYENNFTVTVNTWVARREIQSARADMLRAMLEKDLDVTKQRLDRAEESIGHMKATFPILREHFNGDISLIDQVEKLLNDALPCREQIFELAKSNKNEEAFALMSNEYVPVLEEVTTIFTEISEVADSNAKNMVSSGQKAVIVAIIIVLSIVIVSAIVATLLGLYIAKGIRNPIEEIKSAALNLVKGDLTNTKVLYTSKDELGELSDSIRELVDNFQAIISDEDYLLGEMADGNFTIETNKANIYVGDYHSLLTSMRKIKHSLSNALLQISESSQQVNLGSTQLAESAQSLAEGATEQAGAVEELTATVENVAEISADSAMQAKHAYEDSKKFENEAEKGTAKMKQLNEAMLRINDASQQIAQIIGEIEDIASQTNLLSLNASIEAARAGEAGKGFAVVADQIGKLANDSAQSAVNTRELIVRALEEVKLGSEITESTATSLCEVIDGIRLLAQSSKDTSTRSIEQAETIKQIQLGIEQISNVVQSNSAAAQETSATSEELLAQAESLKELVTQFKL